MKSHPLATSNSIRIRLRLNVCTQSSFLELIFLHYHNTEWSTDLFSTPYCGLVFSSCPSRANSVLHKKWFLKQLLSNFFEQKYGEKAEWKQIIITRPPGMSLVTVPPQMRTRPSGKATAPVLTKMETRLLHTVFPRERLFSIIFFRGKTWVVILWAFQHLVKEKTATSSLVLESISIPSNFFRLWRKD